MGETLEFSLTLGPGRVSNPSSVLALSKRKYKQLIHWFLNSRNNWRTHILEIIEEKGFKHKQAEGAAVLMEYLWQLLHARIFLGHLK